MYTAMCKALQGASLFSFISYFILEGLRHAKNKCGKQCVQGKSPTFGKQILIAHWKYECVLTGMCVWLLLERAGIE